MVKDSRARPKANPYGPPSKSSWGSRVLFCAFLAFAVAATVWIFHKSPRLRPLECTNAGGTGSLTGFGGCHEAP